MNPERKATNALISAAIILSVAAVGRYMGWW